MHAVDYAWFIIVFVIIKPLPWFHYHMFRNIWLCVRYVLSSIIACVVHTAIIVIPFITNILI